MALNFVNFIFIMRINISKNFNRNIMKYNCLSVNKFHLKICLNILLRSFNDTLRLNDQYTDNIIALKCIPCLF